MNKYISVYFSGTGFSISDKDYLASVLYEQTIKSETQIKMGFDGCGVEFDLRGALFANGLDEQCDRVIQRIAKEIKEGHEIILNVYGHSRGGSAALMLAQQLSKVNPKKLSINLALLDPIPGNLISPSTLDPFKMTLANKTMDLRACKPLKRVLALYPYEPLADLAFHAPLFASYPPHAIVEEEVLPGCHAEAETVLTNPGKINEFRIKEFFAKNGTVFLASQCFIKEDEKLGQFILNCYEKALKANKYGKPLIREGHSAKGLYIKSTTVGEYFNEDHKRRAGGDINATVAVGIKQSNSIFSIIKRKIDENPIAWQLFKWTILGLVISSILFLSGGYGAIPVLAVIAAKAGIVSLFIAAPLISATGAALWYGIIKPVALWTVNKLFYPWYSVREDIKPEPLKNGLDSPGKLNHLLDINDQVFNKKEPQKPYHGNDLLSKEKKIEEPLMEKFKNLNFI